MAPDPVNHYLTYGPYYLSYGPRPSAPLSKTAQHYLTYDPRPSEPLSYDPRPTSLRPDYHRDSIHTHRYIGGLPPPNYKQMCEFKMLFISGIQFGVGHRTKSENSSRCPRVCCPVCPRRFSEAHTVRLCTVMQ